MGFYVEQRFQFAGTAIPIIMFQRKKQLYILQFEWNEIIHATEMTILI